MTIEEITNHNQNIHSEKGNDTHADFAKPLPGITKTSELVALIFIAIGGVFSGLAPSIFGVGVKLVVEFVTTPLLLPILSIAGISLGIPLAAFTIAALIYAAGKIPNPTERSVAKDDDQQHATIEEYTHPDYLSATAPTIEELTGTS